MASGLKTLTVTLDGSTQRVIDEAGITRGSSEDLCCQQIVVQADPANGADAFVGDATLDGSNGIALGAGEQLVIDGSARGVKLQEVYVRGTAAQKVHILANPL